MGSFKKPVLMDARRAPVSPRRAHAALDKTMSRQNVKICR